MIPDAPTFWLVPLRPLPVDGGSTLLEADPAAEWVDLRDEDGDVPLSLDAAKWDADAYIRRQTGQKGRFSTAADQLGSVVPIPASAAPPDGVHSRRIGPLAVCESKQGGLVWGIWRAGDVKREGAKP